MCSKSPFPFLDNNIGNQNMGVECLISLGPWKNPETKNFEVLISLNKYKFSKTGLLPHIHVYERRKSMEEQVGRCLITDLLLRCVVTEDHLPAPQIVPLSHSNWTNRLHVLRIVSTHKESCKQLVSNTCQFSFKIKYSTWMVLHNL